MLNKTKASLAGFFNSIYYPILFGLICAYSGVSTIDIYRPCIYILTAMVVLSGLISHDMKVFLVPAFLIYYAIGMDPIEDYFETLAQVPLLNVEIIPDFIICGTLMVATIIFRLIKNGYVKELIAKRGLFFWGIICVDIALLLGGLFTPEFSLKSVLWGAITAFILTVGYMLFTVIIAHSNDSIAYACKTLVVLGFTVAIEVALLALKANECGTLIIQAGEGFVVNRAVFSATWGIATIMGGVMVPPLVSCFYLMHSRRYPMLSFFCSVVILAATMFVTTRSAVIMGALTMIIGMILVCINGRNVKTNRICVGTLTGILLFAAIGFFIFMNESHRILLDEFLTFMRLDFNIDLIKNMDSINFTNSVIQRIALWRNGIWDFIGNPVFGVGFLYGGFAPEEAFSNLYSNMYHNIFIQIAASLGIVGIIAFFIHWKHLAEVTFRHFSVDKLLILLVPLSIFGMSLVDNFFFYPNFLIVYSAFLACSEICLEQKRAKMLSALKPRVEGKRPKVVFTYVEAGKGHIIPTKNVYECFERKYGDKVELIESKFFTETGDENLARTEVLFRRAVQNQNRSPLLSFLCKLGNLIAGDTFALFVLLRMTFSGMHTNKRAVQHVKELDADVIFTAHWSIPFYVNQLKENRPYTVCFCPDVYSNGAFNVDCNHFLISSDVGYNQVAHRMRMYAGGNITQIPFPMRPEVEQYKSVGKRSECRAALGIAEDEFVVVLCDGGYGMARLEKTLKRLIKKKQKMTVIALCGTNHELYLKLTEHAKRAPAHIRVIAVNFTDNVLDYIVTADVFAGKSGANSVAEPAALGIPIVITKCITYIERGIKNYYVHKIGGAIYRPGSRIAANKIAKFAEDRSLLDKYKNNLSNTDRFKYDAEVTADILWEHVKGK